MKGLVELGIVTPTEVQARSIPFLMKNGGDFCAQAQTGTGKTAAFGLPLLTKVDPKKSHIQGLVIAPTRELAKQIAKQLFRYTKYSEKIFVEVLSGGEPMDGQIVRLKRPTHVELISDSTYVGKGMMEWVGFVAGCPLPFQMLT